jgi:YidC/Oxa1 family membrane protein insertase
VCALELLWSDLMPHDITDPLMTLFLRLAQLLAPIGGVTAAIVAVTLAVRAVLHPLTRAAVRGERARRRLAPRLAELRRRHGKDPARVAELSLALHRSEGVSPFAGLWPVVAQAPVFLLLYRIFAEEGAGTLLGERLLTGNHPAAFLSLLVGLTVVAWLTSRRTGMLMRVNADLATGSRLLARLPRVLPYSTVAVAAFLPMALVVYLLTSTAWTLAENTLLRRGLLG